MSDKKYHKAEQLVCSSCKGGGGACGYCGGRGTRARRLDGYYISFEPTGNHAIDKILGAVACAGKAYHHTDSWNDETRRPMELPTKALSIRQPWADAIIWHGKDVENRDWRTNFRGPVLIHAAKKWGPDERADLAFVEDMTATKLEDVDKPLLGGIIGRAEIVDCVESMDSRWFFGRYGFVLRNAEPLDFIPCRGALGFFTPDLSPQPAKAIPTPPQGALQL